MASDSGRVAVLIVSYKNPADVYSCLEALSQATPEPQFDIFICENGGEEAFKTLCASLSAPNGPCGAPDDAAEQSSPVPSQTLTELHRLTLRARPTTVWIAKAAHNLGYAGAVNAIIEQLRPRQDWSGVWVLNPDTAPEPRALLELVARAEAGGMGMVGSTIFDDDDAGRIRCRAGHSWNPVTGRAVTMGFSDATVEPVDVPKIELQLDCISGASMYVTRACLERIGPMDERFFLYYEDMDWGLRAKEFGLGYAAASIIHHKGGTTMGSASLSRTNRSWLAIYLENRNRIYFTRKYHPYYILIILFMSALHALRYLFAGSFRDFQVALSGAVAGLRYEVGPPARLCAEGLAQPRPKVARPSLWRLKLLISAIFWMIDSLGWIGAQLVGPHPASSAHNHLLSRGAFRFPRANLDVKWRNCPDRPTWSSPISRDLSPKGPNVAITFDDAFLSVAENALPELSALALPCMIFVPAGFMGMTPSWGVEDPNSTFREQVMNRSLLAAMSPTLVKLGSHSMSHPHLSELNAISLQVELKSSREELQDVVQYPVKTIAAPYGDLIDVCSRRA